MEGTVQYEDEEKQKISFQVKVTGENISVVEMMISWNTHDASERFTQILINEEVVWDTAKKSGDLLDIVDAILNTSEENNTIQLTFNKDMSTGGKFPITVNFYPPVSGLYPIVLPESP